MMKKARNRSLTVTAQKPICPAEPKRLCLLAMSGRVRRELGQRKEAFFSKVFKELRRLPSAA
jgi:hypothetical protein